MAEIARYAVFDPATGEEVSRAPLMDAAALDRAVDAAGPAGEAWSKTDPEGDRAPLLRRAATAFRTEADDLARTLTFEQGKPLSEARTEVGRLAATFDYYAGLAHLLEDEAREIAGNRRALVLKRPVGVTAAIVPWNFPLTLSAIKVAPALLAGNAVLVKPAPTAPLSVIRMVELLVAAGAPAGLVQAVTSEDPAFGALVASHPGIARLALTGSTPTGRAVMRAAADDLKLLSLELGGSDAMIVAGDADVAAAARAAAIGRFYNAGQACLATKRLFVDRGIVSELVDAIVERAERLPIGHGLTEGVRIGPLHLPAVRDHVEELVADAVDRGAKVATGTDRPEVSGCGGAFLRPGILVDVPAEARIMQEECFGPVLPVTVVDSIHEAIERANDSPFGLGSTVWSSDLALAESAARALDTGYTWINETPFGFDELPFGGVKQSGFGREHGPEGLLSFTVTKSVTLPR